MAAGEHTPVLKCTAYGLLFSLLSVPLFRCVSPETPRSVLELTDTNWTAVLHGDWMLLFYAPWCPACRHIKSDWEEFGKNSAALGISVGKVDVTQQPGLSGRFLVTTLPTIFHAHDGSFRRYLSSRAVEDFQSYIVEKKWAAVEPVPGWKSPSSLVMTGMAGLFRLSVWIRQIHNYLTDTLGIPVWGSYVIFALVTLFTGLFLGLILVLIADYLCPSRPKHRGAQTDTCEKRDAYDAAVKDKQKLDAENENAKSSGEECVGVEDACQQGATSGTENTPGGAAAEGAMRKRKHHTTDATQP